MKQIFTLSSASRSRLRQYFILSTLTFILLLTGMKGWGQTPYLMSGGDYSEQFTNIANTTNWPNGFNGTDCTEWTYVPTNSSGTIGDGVRITVSTATFSTGTSGGVQRGSANIYLLSTSTANSCAIDLLLNFTGRNAGTISFNVATVFNGTGDRDSKLKLFYSIDGTNFTEITGTNLPYTARNNVANSASITNIALPSAFSNCSTARLRFYEYSTTGGATPTGSQPKISIDNVAVTSTASSTPTLSVSALAGFGNICVGSTAGPNSFTITGTNLSTADVTVAELSGFTYSTSSSGTYYNSLTLPSAGGGFSQTVYVKFTPVAAQSYNGNIVVSGGGASSVNCAATGSGVAHVDPVITTSDATYVFNTKATLNGNINTLEVCPASTAKGFIYSKTSENNDPLIGGSYVTDVPVAGIATGNFTNNLTGLTANTGYSYKAYIYNGSTYAYGAVKTFSTLNVASKLAWGTAPPSTGVVNSNLAQFTVLAQRPDGTTDVEYTGNITISKASGPGNIVGTLTVAAVAGVATFSSIQFDATGTYTITASSGSLTTVTSGNIVISVAPVSLGTYTFTGTSCSTAAYTASGVASNISYSLISISNISCNSNVLNAFSGSASWGTAISTSRYVEFTLSPNSGFLLTANSVVFDIWRSSAGATNYAVRSSIDNFTADLATGTVTTSQTTIPSITLSSSFANLSSGVTFRIYGWGGSGSGDLRIDNISVNGNVVSNLQAPTATSATGISASGFTANWNAVSGATGYFLDVATTSNFTATNTVATEGFENSMSLFTVTSGSGTYYSGNSASGDNPASSPFYSEGSYGYGKTGTGSATTVTITSSDINTSALTSPELSFNLASFSVPTGNGADGGDYVSVDISPNGGTNYYPTIRVIGASNATWAFSNTGVASTLYDGDGSVVEYNTASGTVKVTGLPSVTNLKVKISMYNDHTAERWIIDNFKLIGNTSTTLFGYSNLSVSGTSQAVTGLSSNTTYYYRVRATDGTFISDNSNPITVLTAPGAFNVTGGGSFCSGGTGVAVGLDGSQTGVSYHLYNGSTTVGSLVSGTGNALDFGLQTAGGTYTVTGTNAGTNGGGTTTMAGSAVITENARPVAAITIVNTSICNGSSTNITGTITASGSWTLTLSSGGTVTGSGSGSWNKNVSPTTTTTYSISSLTDENCTSQAGDLTGSTEVTVNDQVTPSVSISASANPVYQGTSVTFTPAPINGGTTPTYEWFVGASSQGTGSTFAYVPSNGNTIHAVMTSNAACASPLTATSNVITMSVTNEITWTGAVSTAWNEPGNWNPNLVPNLAHAHIPFVGNQPHIFNSGNTPNSIIMDAGAVLTIEDGGTLTLNTGIITKDNSTSNNLVVKSGGLLRHSFGSINARIERVITPGHWHNISSPVVGAKSGVFESYFLMDFTTNGSQYHYITATDQTLNPLQGYSVFVDGTSDFTAVFSGFTHYNSSLWYHVNVSNAGEGWNLVGNPFPWPVYWNIPTAWDKTNVDNAIYIENGGLWASFVDNVGTNGGSGNISSCQGFFVHAIGTGQLSVSANAQMGTNGFLKEGNEIVPDLVRLQISGNGFKDEAVVRLTPEATPEFDGNYDAFKLYGSEEKAPQLYSLGTAPLAINSIPEAVPIPVGVKAGMSGSYTIAATEINDLTNVKLEDTKTGIITSLADNSYTFNWEAGEDEHRFVLRFASVGMSEPDDANSFIYSYDKTVSVELPMGVKGDIYIYNLAGQPVAAKESVTGQVRINLSPTGVYVVKVVTDKETLTKKVWIR